MPDDTARATPLLPWRVEPDDRPKPSGGVYVIMAEDDEIVCSISPREVGQIIVDAVNSRADHAALETPRLWADEHRILRCDATTGHFARPIALCDTPRIAAMLVNSYAARAAIAKATGGGDA